MTYYDTAADITITRSKAFEVLEEHGIPVDEFLKEVGYANLYDAQSVLDWLGY